MQRKSGFTLLCLALAALISGSIFAISSPENVIIGLVLIVICVITLMGALFIFLKHISQQAMPRERATRKTDYIFFCLSLAAFIISLRLFWNVSVYADEYGSSPFLVASGMFWLLMDWLRLGLLFVLSLISGLRLIKRSA